MRLIIIALALVLTSCVSQKACDRKFPPSKTTRDSVVVVIKDSIVIKDSVTTKIVDSIVYTAAIKDSGELDTKENQTYRFKNGSAEVIIKIKDGKVSYKIDLSATESRYKTEITALKSQIEIYKSKDSISSHTEVVVTPAPKIPWYMKLWNGFKDLLAWIGLLVMIYFFVRYVILKFMLKTGG